MWTLVELAAPSAVSMMLSVFGGVVSMLWLGRLVGPIGLGVAASMVAVELCVGAIFQAIANGTMSLLSRAIGAGSARASRIVLASLLLTLLIGGLLCCAGIALCSPLAALLTRDPEILPLVRSYAIGFSLAIPLLGLATVAIAIFAAAGWAQLAFWRGVTELVLLAILTPVLVGWLGPIGAPLAVLVASAIVVGWLGWTLWREWDGLKLGPRPASYLAVDRSLWGQIAAIGVPPQIGRIANFVAFGFMVKLVLEDSTVVAGAFGVGYRLLILACSFGYGCSRAQAIVAGQCIGAGHARRAVASLWMSFVLGLAVGLVLILATPLARPVVQLFTQNPLVIDATLRSLDVWRWLVLPITAWYMFLAAYSATGRVKLASVATVLGDVAAVVLVFVLGPPWSSAALWGVVTQHVVRAVLLALLVRHAFLGPVAEICASRAARELG